MHVRVEAGGAPHGLAILVQDLLDLGVAHDRDVVALGVGGDGNEGGRDGQGGGRQHQHGLAPLTPGFHIRGRREGVHATLLMPRTWRGPPPGSSASQLSALRARAVIGESVAITPQEGLDGPDVAITYRWARKRRHQPRLGWTGGAEISAGAGSAGARTGAIRRGAAFAAFTLLAQPEPRRRARPRFRATASAAAGLALARDGRAFLTGASDRFGEDRLPRAGSATASTSRMASGFVRTPSPGGLFRQLLR